MLKRTAGGPAVASNQGDAPTQKRRRIVAQTFAGATAPPLDQWFQAQGPHAAERPLHRGANVEAPLPRAQETAWEAPAGHALPNQPAAADLHAWPPPAASDLQHAYQPPRAAAWLLEQLLQAAPAAAWLQPQWPGLLPQNGWLQQPLPGPAPATAWPQHPWPEQRPGIPNIGADSVHPRDPVAQVSDIFLPDFASLGHHQTQAMLLGVPENHPIFSGLHALASIALGAREATPQALPGAAEEAAMLLALPPNNLPPLGVDTNFWAPETPRAGSMLVAQFATVGAPEASPNTNALYVPEASPFYEGEKIKGMTTPKKKALIQTILQHNQGVAEHQRVRLEGAVRAEKISIFTGERNAYVVSGKIAQGTYGKFRGAVCLETGEPFGVKELRSQRAPLPTGRRNPNTEVTPDRQTRSELDLLALVSQALPVHEVVDYRGKIYVFLPWMDGDAYALSKGAMSPRERLCTGRSLAYQVTHDLETCHKAGYIHHDLKLLNILWHANGTIAVSDYGLARPIGKTFFNGTPGMYAPELLARRPYGPNSDMWGLGITYFHFLLSHRRLPLDWKGDSAQAIRQARALNERFFVWRESVKQADGQIDPSRILASQESFGPYFSEALQADGPMTWMFLQYILAPADERDSSHVFRQRMDKLDMYAPSTRLAAQVAASRVAGQNDKKHNIVGALHARRAQVLNMP